MSQDERDANADAEAEATVTEPASGDGASSGAEPAPGDATARYTAGPRDRERSDPRPVPRAVLVVAIVVPLVLLVVALVWVRRLSGDATDPGASDTAPAAVATVPAPEAPSAECRAFVDALPATLGGARRVPMVEPAPAGAAAYRPTGGADVQVVRCGLEAPPEFVVGSALQQVDQVQWFRQTDAQPGAAQTATWFAVDRTRYVAVTLDRETGSATLQELSAVVADTLAARTPIPAPAR